jgi:hypothetical protein
MSYDSELSPAPDRPVRSSAWNGSRQIKKGAVVWHLIFGLGKVVLHDKGQNQIRIKFRAHGEKVLIPTFARARLRIALP